MSAQVCAECTAAYSIGAAQCPQCGANNPRPDGEGPAAPSTAVRCPGEDCEAYGVVRNVPVQLVAPGIEARPQMHCTACGRHVEVVHDEETGDDDMPKVTLHGGASDATFDGEGGEESSPTPEEAGGTSSASSKKEPTSPETSENETPQPARTTGNRSAKGRTGSSSARGTAGAQTAPSSDGSEG
jgi:hypothetical protein